MRIALIGYGNVGRAFAGLLQQKRAAYPFRIVAIHTARHGTAYRPGGLALEPSFGPAARSVDEFLDKAECDVVGEITTLNPATGEPALSHIRGAFSRGRHVITANKGPIAHAYSTLRDEARKAKVEFRFESTVMDGAPVFNLVRHTLPGARVLGFTGVLNSTTKIIIGEMHRGKSLLDGIRVAQLKGIAEADASYDVDGWDAAAKTAILANVLLDARMTPLDVSRRGIGRLTAARVLDLGKAGKTVSLVSRARITPSGVKARVRAEVLPQTDLLAALDGTSNVLLLHTDLMGTIGTLVIKAGVEQTAYGLFSDVVNIAEASR